MCHKLQVKDWVLWNTGLRKLALEPQWNALYEGPKIQNFPEYVSPEAGTSGGRPWFQNKWNKNLLHETRGGLNERREKSNYDYFHGGVLDAVFIGILYSDGFMP